MRRATVLMNKNMSIRNRLSTQEIIDGNRPNKSKRSRETNNISALDSHTDNR